MFNSRLLLCRLRSSLGWLCPCGATEQIRLQPLTHCLAISGLRFLPPNGVTSRLGHSFAFCAAQRFRCASAILFRASGLSVRLLRPVAMLMSSCLPTLAPCPLDNKAFTCSSLVISASSSLTISSIVIGKILPGVMLQGIRSYFLSNVQWPVLIVHPQVRSILSGWSYSASHMMIPHSVS